MSVVPENRASRWPVWLRATDQVCCVGVVLLALAWMGSSWMYQGGLQGRVIDIDQAPRQTLSFQLDINRAGWTEWSALPGIGETLARRIVATREERGGFRRHDDLLHVPGIGPRTLDRLRPFLAAVEERP